MILPKHPLDAAPKHAQVRSVRGSPWRANDGTGPKTPAGIAAISATNTKHGRYKNWREKQAKEQYYRAEIKRVMREAELAGLLVSG